MLGTFVSPPEYRRMLAGAEANASPWLDFAETGFDEHYNRKPFLMRHRLQDSALFELSALRALARRIPHHNIHHRFGAIPKDAHFDSSLSRFRDGLSLDDALDQLEERQAYVGIYNPESDPEYRPLIESLVAEIARRTETLDPVITWYSSYVFISAHESVTPYHMDREMNFLLQIRGHKIVQLWDPADPAVMTPAEKDYLLASHAADARPRYRDALEAKAMRFDLHPGHGVHQPFIAPHLVRTGQQLSISLALTWRTRDSDTRTHAHCINQRLRKLGLRPATVGAHPAVDSAKAAVYNGLHAIRCRMRPSADAPSGA